MNMIGIHFVCCFFSTHKSQLTPSWLLLHVSVCGGDSSRPAPLLFPPSEAPCVWACCLCPCSVCVLSAVRGRVVCVFNKTVNPFPLSPVSSTREQSEVPDSDLNKKGRAQVYVSVDQSDWKSDLETSAETQQMLRLENRKYQVNLRFHFTVINRVSSLSLACNQRNFAINL